MQTKKKDFLSPSLYYRVGKYTTVKNKGRSIIPIFIDCAGGVLANHVGA